jgi:hypothetical protein
MFGLQFVSFKNLGIKCLSPSGLEFFCNVNTGFEELIFRCRRKQSYMSQLSGIKMRGKICFFVLLKW